MSPLEQSGDLTAERLELLVSILGRDWLDGHLREYKSFRECYSVPSRWWHRPPEFSAIIPLAYSARPGPRVFLDEPFGVWRGDPTGILARLLASIVEFKEYWERLPEGRGINNLRYAFRNPWRFFSIRHELRLATHIKASDYHIAPLFFDPSSDKGNADIVVEDGDKTYDVQCKSRNPSVASDMPYDVFQFFAGRWSRLVADSGRSFFLFLDLKQRLDAKGASQLLDEAQSVISTKSATSTQFQSDGRRVEIVEVGNSPGMVSPHNVTQKASLKAGESLYSDIEFLKPISALSKSPQVVGCHITGSRQRGIEDYVFSTAENAARVHSGKNPLIISINVYQETDISAYMNSLRVLPKYAVWSKRFFSKYPNVAMLVLSSNFDRYFQTGRGNVALATKYLLVESPYWDNVLPHLGIADV